MYKRTIGPPFDLHSLPFTSTKSYLPPCNFSIVIIWDIHVFYLAIIYLIWHLISFLGKIVHLKKKENGIIGQLSDYGGAKDKGKITIAGSNPCVYLYRSKTNNQV